MGIVRKVKEWKLDKKQKKAIKEAQKAEKIAEELFGKKIRVHQDAMSQARGEIIRYRQKIRELIKSGTGSPSVELAEEINKKIKKIYKEIARLEGEIKNRSRLIRELAKDYRRRISE